jgi:hypothetical protein
MLSSQPVISGALTTVCGASVRAVEVFTIDSDSFSVGSSGRVTLASDRIDCWAR